MICPRCSAPTKGVELSPGCISAVCDKCHKTKAPTGSGAKRASPSPSPSPVATSPGRRRSRRKKP